MELKIKISEDTYEEIKRDDKILLSKVHELFDAVRNGRLVTTAKNKIDNLLILNEEEAKVFNSLSEEQRRVVGILLDNAAKQTEEKDKANNKPVSEKELNDNAEICRLMEVYLGRGLDEHEIQILSLYKTVENEKEMLAGLSGMDRILMKIMIRSLVS